MHKLIRIVKAIAAYGWSGLLALTALDALTSGVTTPGIVVAVLSLVTLPFVFSIIRNKFLTPSIGKYSLVGLYVISVFIFGTTAGEINSAKATERLIAEKSKTLGISKAVVTTCYKKAQSPEDFDEYMATGEALAGAFGISIDCDKIEAEIEKRGFQSRSEAAQLIAEGFFTKAEKEAELKRQTEEKERLAALNQSVIEAISQSEYYGLINKSVKGVDYKKLGGKPCDLVMDALRRTKSVPGDAMINATFLYNDENGQVFNAQLIQRGKYDCSQFFKSPCKLNTEGNIPGTLVRDEADGKLLQWKSPKDDSVTYYNYDRVSRGIVDIVSYLDGRSNKKELERLLCIQPR